MTHVDVEQLILQRDEALAKVQRLEATVAEQRVWLRNRPKPSRRPRFLAWSGVGSLAGSLVGTALGFGVGNLLFIPLIAGFGLLAGGVAALGSGLHDNGVNPEEDSDLDDEVEWNGNDDGGTWSPND